MILGFFKHPAESCTEVLPYREFVETILEAESPFARNVVAVHPADAHHSRLQRAESFEDIVTIETFAATCSEPAIAEVVVKQDKDRINFQNLPYDFISRSIPFRSDRQDNFESVLLTGIREWFLISDYIFDKNCFLHETPPFRVLLGLSSS